MGNLATTSDETSGDKTDEEAEGRNFQFGKVLDVMSKKSNLV